MRFYYNIIYPRLVPCIRKMKKISRLWVAESNEISLFCNLVKNLLISQITGMGSFSAGGIDICFVAR